MAEGMLAPPLTDEPAGDPGRREMSTLTTSSSSAAAPSRHLRHHLVPALPSSVCYVPGFLGGSACDALLAAVGSVPPHRWTNLSRRRLLSLPSALTGKARDTLVLSPCSPASASASASASVLPPYLVDGIVARFAELGVFDGSPHGLPNHVLVNEYLPAQGIMPHEDGPAYHPVTATISLGASVVLDIYSKSVPGSGDSGRKHWRILQEPGSLLVTMGECYAGTLHGIAEVEVDEDLGEETVANWGLLGDKEQFRDRRNIRGTRVSLTYRDVRKVVQMGGGARNTIAGNHRWHN